MLDQKHFIDTLINHEVDFFVGVPDSYLNGFCNYLLEYYDKKNIIAANEGNAVGIAAGYYFATGRIPLVYMQNSGMGNALNPLVSLADTNVYSVPMILLIGWRGQPGTNDWPQHKLQGEITTKLLDIMHIPYSILENDDHATHDVINFAIKKSRTERKPYALIVPKGIMSGEKENITDSSYPLSREEAIETIMDNMPNDTIYSATTGRATRELFYLRKRRGEKGDNDYLNVGSMGHASSVAMGIALSRPGRKVVVLDGDCAAMMHMGAMTMVSKLDIPNLIHIVLNNGSHESVGGQPSAGMKIDFTGIAESCGYATIGRAVTNREELIAAVKKLSDMKKASFIDVRIHKGLRGKLPSLDFSPKVAIDGLISNLNSEVNHE